MSDRNLGKMGEYEFRQWCAQVDLAANSPDEDSGGWDYLVQFKNPSVPSSLVSLDRLELPTACLVQVKSMDHKCAPDITLSNWLKLVNPAFPAFVLLLDFQCQDHPVEANLVPVDKKLIERVLRRLRQLDVGARHELHKHTLSVRWSPEHGLPSCNGVGLLSKMKEHIGSSPRQYWESKKSWHDEAGNVHYKFTITTRGTPDLSAEDQLVDFALGLTKELPSTLTGFDEIRFDIAVPDPVAGSLPRDVTLSAPQLPHLAGTLELTDKPGVRRVRLPCQLYHPRRLFPFISDSHLRFRVAVPNVDFLFSTHSPHAQVKVSAWTSGLDPLSWTGWLRRSVVG